MRILVINGSPKGKNSVTLQTVRYLEKRFPQATFQYLHAGAQIKKLEQDFLSAADDIARADVLLFAYPVYTFIAPYQLHRFIELMKAERLPLEGKFAAEITTSKHFYDVTAHRYIEENCLDLGLAFLGGLSADMDDLLKPQGQRDAMTFMNYLLYCAEHDIAKREKAIVPAPRKRYEPTLPETPKRAGKRIAIVTNCAPDDETLHNMIHDFTRALPYASDVVNIAEYPFQGGCLGCFSCAATGRCVYRDGFDTFLRERIQTADAIVTAFTIRDHSMGASFKRYDDRQFCNGHRTVTMGKPTAVLVSGDYAREANLRMIVEGRADVGHNFLAGVATDEGDTARALRETAEKLAYALDHGVTQPQTFLGVGGMKIFRDLIYVMRGMMKADHRFYKENGFYDFPQKQRGTILKMQLVGWLLSSKAVQKKLSGGGMNDAILGPYKKVVDGE